MKTLGGSSGSPKWTSGPALGDDMVSVERTVHDGGSHLQHQMSAPRRPAHLLLSIHSPVQQPLHRALVGSFGQAGARYRAGDGKRQPAGRALPAADGQDGTNNATAVAAKTDRSDSECRRGSAVRYARDKPIKQPEWPA